VRIKSKNKNKFAERLKLVKKTAFVVKKYLLLVIVLLTFGFFSYAQNTPAQDSKKSLPVKPEKEESGTQTVKRQTSAKKESQEKRAANQIKELKKGILLVRLRTQENAIKSLEKANNKAGAEKIRAQQAQANKQLINAFQANFTFCPVYFFYSSETENVKNGNTNGIFLDNNLNFDANIKLPEKSFFIAEVTNVEQERPDPNDLNSNNNSEASFPALVMRDSLFNQLADPFPYFVKLRQSFPPRKRTEPEYVSILNKRLLKFHDFVISGR
jgi:hypothetical protein